MLNTQQILRLRGNPPPKQPGYAKRRQGQLTEERVVQFFLDNPQWHDSNAISKGTGLSVQYVPQITRRLHLSGFLVRKEIKRGKTSRAAAYRAACHE